MKKKGNEEMPSKMTYQKPQLEQVQLVVEEAVLSGCKTGTGGSVPKCKKKSTGCISSPFRS